ncbi:MAG: magnesium transporter [Anaerolineales bacterium]|nr:magnesium transporter [Anaerolineales bacterium]
MDDQNVNMPDVEEIEALLAANKLDELKTLLHDVHPADIADLLDQLDADEAVQVFNLFSIETASEILDESGSLVRQEIVEKVDDEKLADLLDELPMDDAAEFLDDLPDQVANRLIGLMEPEEAYDVRELLSYEDETAGRLMTRDVAALRANWTVSATFEFLRSLEDTETLHYLYVVDATGRLIGILPIRDLIMAQPDQTIEKIMTPDIIAAPVTIDQEHLAEMMARYDFFAMPVVDEDGRLQGVVTLDDVLDVFEEEVTEDIQRLGGSEPLDQPYFAVSVFDMFKKRVGWLLLLFLAATLTGTVINLYTEQLQAAIALSLFIPLIIGTGGNAGSQTVATIIRAITLDEVRLGNLWQAWRKEVSVGLLLGIAMAGLGFVRAVTWGEGVKIGLIVGLTLPLVVIWAITVATIVPTVADRFRIDPAVISGPMITTIVDTTGLMIYFQLATIILN